MTLQASTVSESLKPLSARTQMFLVFDGACSEHGLRSWYDLGLDVCPLMVLKDGVYDGISALGPMIADLGGSRVLKELWESNHPIMHRAAVYHTSHDEPAFLDFMRARVQVIMPMDRTVWLRLGDGRVVSRLPEADGRFPLHFWTGVDAIFFRPGDESVRQYRPSQTMEASNQDEHAPLSTKVMPCFHFSSDLMSALDSSTDLNHREV